MAVYRSVDHLYNRAMGRPYDSDMVVRQVANGDRSGYPEDDEEEETYSLNGSDLIIAPAQVRLTIVGHELDKLRDKYIEGRLYAKDINPFVIQEAEIVSESLHQQYKELAEEDAKYARAVQDWTVDELRARHPNFAIDQKDSTPEQVAQQLLETACVVGELITELETEDEDPRLIYLAQTWQKELLADCMVAEFKHYYALAA
jgi:hypothetical protein